MRIGLVGHYLLALVTAAHVALHFVHRIVMCATMRRRLQIDPV
jgi:hypothetical protein